MRLSKPSNPATAPSSDAKIVDASTVPLQEPLEVPIGPSYKIAIDRNAIIRNRAVAKEKHVGPILIKDVETDGVHRVFGLTVHDEFGRPIFGVQYDPNKPCSCGDGQHSVWINIYNGAVNGYTAEGAEKIFASLDSP